MTVALSVACINVDFSGIVRDPHMIDMATRANPTALPLWARSILLRSPSFWQGQLIAFACVVAAALVRFALTPLIGAGVPFITFFPIILIASLLAGPRAGASALILSTLVAVAFWMDRSGLALSRESWVRLGVFWLLCLSLITTAGLLRALVRTLVESEERALILAHEMTHRARNVLGLAHAISRQTFQSATSLADYQTLFESRLLALSRAQDLVTQSPANPTDLKTLLDRVLEPFETQRFTITGSSVGVPHELGSTVALLVHELCTNSLKYGALSAPDGCVIIKWMDEGHRIRLDWQERGGPPVAPPARAGFGSRLLQTAFPPGRGAASIAYHPHGVECWIVFTAARTRSFTRP